MIMPEKGVTLFKISPLQCKKVASKIKYFVEDMLRWHGTSVYINVD